MRPRPFEFQSLQSIFSRKGAKLAKYDHFRSGFARRHKAHEEIQYRRSDSGRFASTYRFATWHGEKAGAFKHRIKKTGGLIERVRLRLTEAVRNAGRLSSLAMGLVLFCSGCANGPKYEYAQRNDSASIEGPVVPVQGKAYGDCSIRSWVCVQVSSVNSYRLYPGICKRTRPSSEPRCQSIHCTKAGRSGRVRVRLLRSD